MEICKNKKTGKVFIYVDELDNKNALMITPLGDLKKLEYHLFTKPIEIDDEEVLLAKDQINSKQYNV